MKLQINKKQALKIFLVIIVPTVYYILYINGIVIKCLFHEITGFECPGCGITRMFVNIIEFDLKSAYFCNPLIFVLLPLLIPYILYLIIVWIFNKEDKITKKIPKKLLYVLLIITVIFGILRNLN